MNSKVTTVKLRTINNRTEKPQENKKTVGENLEESNINSVFYNECISIIFLIVTYSHYTM